MQAISCLGVILLVIQIGVPPFCVAADQETTVTDPSTKKSSAFETDLLEIFSKEAPERCCADKYPAIVCGTADAWRRHLGETRVIRRRYFLSTHLQDFLSSQQRIP